MGIALHGAEHHAGRAGLPAGAEQGPGLAHAEISSLQSRDQRQVAPYSGYKKLAGILKCCFIIVF